MAKITLVLDNLRSCYNVGSIIRSANGFKCHNFIFLGTTPYPLLKNDPRFRYQSLKQAQQIAKTALGAQTTIQGRYFPNINHFLKEKGDCPLVCLETTNQSQAIQGYRLNQDIYLVIGNEIEGVSQDLLNQADSQLHIPMLGSKKSFNVAVAVGIALYQLMLTSN